MSEFKPGLEGVVAFETEIAEPDRDGGALRYRGVDIEDLVGMVPFEKVWGLLVDDAPEPGLQPRPPVRGPRPHGQRSVRPPGGHGAARRRVGSRAADRHHRRGGPRRPRATLGDDDLDRRAIGASCRRIHDTRSIPSSSRQERRRLSDSCSSGAARPIRGTSRRSTRTGSARPSTGSTRRRSRPGSSRRPVPTAPPSLASAVGALSGPAPRRRARARPADARRSGGGRLDRGLRERSARLR